IRPDTAAMRRKADVASGVPVTNVSVVPDMVEVSRMAMKAEPVAKALSTVIRGIVISAEDSLPIPGAVIAIKGTDNIAVTDAEGRFTLAALADTSQMLVGKFIGMNDTEVRISGDDLQKITMSQSLLTLDEVVVVGYGTSQSSRLGGAVSGVSVSLETPVAEYKAAEPANGYPAFREYIKQNIIYPEGAAGGTREVVVVDLPVTREGTTGTPVIVRSPGEAFSEAAIKLLQNGPLWKPSSMNGISSDDTVRIRLVFRK
ncbi:MAG: carboxypeptidase-like regulatory domain-containing protein, partial [Bacteroidales bacterium]|nr:carboxypeptidase-like regulatory domain-containing protein [Bacteroidales bacterium]